MFKSNTQPHCRYCGKPIGKETHRAYVWINDDGSVSLRFGFSFNAPARALDASPQSRADCQRLINGRVLSVDYRELDGKKTIRSFTFWDGESYKDELFCGVNHAARLGALAARSSHQIATAAYYDAVGAKK